MKQINILLSIVIGVYSVMSATLEGNSCWWDNCQDETRAFSTYYS